MDRLSTVAAMTLALSSASCSATGAGERLISTPVPVALTGYANDKVSRDGRLTFSAQPDAGALRLAAEAGIRTVINLRSAAELETLPFDEPQLVRELGMTYVSIPLTPDAFDPRDVARFAEELDRRAGPVLIHCASSNRVGGLWAAYLAIHRGRSMEDALELGRAAGLTSPKMVEATRRVVERAPDR